jgi:hypothetical protein
LQHHDTRRELAQPNGTPLRNDAAETKSAAEAADFFSQDQDGAVEKTRTSTGYPTATSTLRVYQFRHDREKPGSM